MLEIKDLSTYYYTDDGVVKAVDGVSLSIGQGEFFGLAGESGCGKSTLGLSILRLIEEPGRIEKGNIILEGSDLMSLNEAGMIGVRGAKISMIFQDPFTSLNPVITAGEQIEEGIRLHLGLGKAEAKAKAREALLKVRFKDGDKDEVLNKYPHQLSGGMRQRVMISIAVSCGARLLIADEPTTALDVTTQAAIMELLEELRVSSGLSIMLISHNRRLISRYCKRAALMETGRVVASGKPEDIFRE